MKTFLLALCLSIAALGQVPAVNSGTATYPTSGTILTTAPTGGTVDFSGEAHTLSVKVVANTGALPVTCTAGELAVVTSATIGQQIYQCSAGNIWTQQLNSGSATGGGITMYSATGLTVTANTYYIPLGGGGSISTTEANVDIDSPAAATVTNMYVQLSTALGMGNSGVFTMRKNGASQSVTCTISGAVTTSCSDTTHSFAVSQGDLLTIQLVTSGTIVVTPNILIAAQFGNITATGTVNTGTANQFTYYAANGSAVSGINLFATNAQTGTYQVLAADFIACKTIPVASGTFTITLVASGSQPASGQCITVINYGSGVVTIARSGQNINGGTASLTLAAGSATAPTGAYVVSDGTNYEVALFGASSASAVTVPRHIQSVSSARTGSGAVPASLAYHRNVTSGSCLIVGMGWEAGANTNPTISDTLTTTWTRQVVLTGDANENGAIFTGTASSGGADTVTFTFPASAGFAGAFISEFGSCTTTVDATASVRDAALSITTTVAGDLVWSLFQGSTGAAIPIPPVGFLGMNTNGNDSGAAGFTVQPSGTGVVDITPNCGTGAIGSVGGGCNNTHWANFGIALQHP